MTHLHALINSRRPFVYCFLFTVFCLLFSVFGSSDTYASEEVYYLHQDHLGSTAIITNADQEVVSQSSYYPYGNTRNAQQATSNKLTEKGYTGQISDEDQTDLYYYNARYYKANIGKFTQADTIPDQLNRYAYVANNPVNKVDDSGLISLESCIKDGKCKVDPDSECLLKNNCKDGFIPIVGSSDKKWRFYFSDTYVAQRNDSQCNLASSAMMFKALGIMNKDINDIYNLLEDVKDVKSGSGGFAPPVLLNVLNDFLKKHDLPYEAVNRNIDGRNKRASTFDEFWQSINTYGATIFYTSLSYRPIDQCVISNSCSGDPQVSLDHYVVVFGTTVIDGNPYVIVGDPYRAMGGPWLSPEKIPGIITKDGDPNLYVPWNMFNNATSPYHQIYLQKKKVSGSTKVKQYYPI